MSEYCRQKLAQEPRRVRGWRTVKAGSHRVIVALLPGGGTRATSLRHPTTERRKNPERSTTIMATRKQIAASKRNIKKAQRANRGRGRRRR